jgi:ribosomal-protein-alanine N-acetyltransferase
VAIADDWPPELYDADAIHWSLRALERDPTQLGWLVYYCIRTAPAHALPKLIGVGGFKGRPDAHGMVEIGYGIVHSERRHGYATEMAHGLLVRAFSDSGVARVAAETMPDLVASIGVIEKVGMRLVGAGAEPGVIRFEVSRTEYEGSDSPRLPT